MLIGRRGFYTISVVPGRLRIQSNMDPAAKPLVQRARQAFSWHCRHWCYIRRSSNRSGCDALAGDAPFNARWANGRAAPTAGTELKLCIGISGSHFLLSSFKLEAPALCLHFCSPRILEKKQSWIVQTCTVDISRSLRNPS
jgi:hypothetical protein